jgi:hypothetical protein
LFREDKQASWFPRWYCNECQNHEDDWFEHPHQDLALGTGSPTSLWLVYSQWTRAINSAVQDDICGLGIPGEAHQSTHKVRHTSQEYVDSR